jgi:hypothetical protein
MYVYPNDWLGLSVTANPITHKADTWRLLMLLGVVEPEAQVGAVVTADPAAQ